VGSLPANRAKEIRINFACSLFDRPALAVPCGLVDERGRRSASIAATATSNPAGPGAPFREDRIIYPLWNNSKTNSRIAQFRITMNYNLELLLSLIRNGFLRHSPLFIRIERV
jgi:hypothetical protein